MLLPMLCSVMPTKWFPLKLCRVEMCGMLFVIYGSSVFSSVFAITEKSEMGLYDVHVPMSLLGLGIGMMFASLHARGMILLSSDVPYIVGEICES